MSQSQSEARKALRTKLLSEQIKRVVVQIDGMDIEVRQMSVGQMLDNTQEEDKRRQMANYVIACCYVPDTEERIFDEADLEVLMAMPAGGYYTKIMEAITKQTLPSQLEKAGKA